MDEDRRDTQEPSGQDEGGGLLEALGISEDDVAAETLSGHEELPAPACRVVGVSVLVGNETILHDVSLDFPAHACTVIMGPSGSGKSTLLKTAAGLIVPDEGHVEILGTDLRHAPDREMEHLRSRNGFVFQDDALWQNLSLEQNLTLPLEYHHPDLDRTEMMTRIHRLLGELDADQKLAQRPATVSAGQRKLISFVRGIVGNPEILFLDEPTTSIDGERTDLMIRKLRELKSTRMTLVAVTHNARIASQLADYVVVLKAGTVLRFGTLHEISRSKEPEIERILTDVLSDAATYDGDILELLDPDTNTYLT